MALSWDIAIRRASPALGLDSPRTHKVPLLFFSFLFSARAPLICCLAALNSWKEASAVDFEMGVGVVAAAAAAVTKAAALSEETLFKEAPTSSRKSSQRLFFFLSFFHSNRERKMSTKRTARSNNLNVRCCSQLLPRSPPLVLSLSLSAASPRSFAHRRRVSRVEVRENN